MLLQIAGHSWHLAEVRGGVEQHELGGAGGMQDDAPIGVRIRQRPQEAHQPVQCAHLVRVITCISTHNLRECDSKSDTGEVEVYCMCTASACVGSGSGGSR